MIDRKARNKLAEEIRHFMGCFTDNFEYDDAVFDIDSDDRGVIEVRQQVWVTYDDLRQHKMEGKWALPDDQMVIIKRCIVFLKSDIEYEWPKWPILYILTRPLIWLITLGRLTEVLDRHFNRAGKTHVWPFHTEKDYEAAKKNPRYCANSA